MKDAKAAAILTHAFDKMAAEYRANLISELHDTLSLEDIEKALKGSKVGRKGPAIPASLTHLIAAHLTRYVFETISDEAGEDSVDNAYRNLYLYLSGRKICTEDMGMLRYMLEKK